MHIFCRRPGRKKPMPDTLFRIPEYITVHLGRPDSNARNVTVPFSDYIKNVASSEIYPTWPESALRANILAEISLALNRIFTEYYPSRGYNFDITNSTQYDQSFVPGRDYFSNISEIVDEIFNNYVRRRGTVEPLFTQYCDGIEVSCKGLSQWGTVDLAKRGYTPYEILKYYYGDDIDIVTGRIGDPVESYPGIPLRLGSAGEDVRVIQLNLNRIRKNYPLIPKISSEDGIFDGETENAVKTFQRIFNLTPDGIVGKATWYQIKRIFFAVKRTSELFSEGISVDSARRKFPYVLEIGSTGTGVRTLQLYLQILSYFIPEIPYIEQDGIFGERTRDAVIAFQRYSGLTADGIVGRNTWNAIVNRYSAIENNLQQEFSVASTLPAPGFVITEGSRGQTVRQIQEYINVIASRDPAVPAVAADGVYGAQTANAVRAIQRQSGIEQTGEIGAVTWNEIISRYNSYK